MGSTVSQQAYFVDDECNCKHPLNPSHAMPNFPSQHATRRRQSTSACAAPSCPPPPRHKPGHTYGSSSLPSSAQQRPSAAASCRTLTGSVCNVHEWNPVRRKLQCKLVAEEGPLAWPGYAGRGGSRVAKASAEAAARTTSRGGKACLSAALD